MTTAEGYGSKQGRHHALEHMHWGGQGSHEPKAGPCTCHATPCLQTHLVIADDQSVTSAKCTCCTVRDALCCTVRDATCCALADGMACLSS